MEHSAEFFRQKAAQCRELVASIQDRNATLRGLEAMALELDACAVAIEAGRATEQEIDGPRSSPDGNGSASR